MLHKMRASFEENLTNLSSLADIAQLVERDLAKVEVTSSNLVIRSNSSYDIILFYLFKALIMLEFFLVYPNIVFII